MLRSKMNLNALDDDHLHENNKKNGDKTTVQSHLRPISSKYMDAFKSSGCNIKGSICSNEI